MPSQLQVFRATGFQGGRNTRFSPRDLGPDESPDDLNMDGRTIGAIKVRAGIKKFSQTLYGSDAITGLYRYYKTDGTPYLMVLNGTNLWAGRGTPPDNQIVKADYTPGSWMTFGTMQDWCYEGNWEDNCFRFNGEGLDRVGLPAPHLIVTYPRDIQNSEGTSGDMDAGYYYYRFRFKYGKLGRSNLSLNWEGVTVTADEATITLTQLESMRPGNNDGTGATNLYDAFEQMPTELEIWRSLNVQTNLHSGVKDLPYYYVDTVKFPDTGAVEYEDSKNDDQLLTLYEGNTYSEPYGVELCEFGQWTAMMYENGYQPTPRARYVHEHRNRMWFANIQQDEVDPRDQTGEYPDTVSRVEYPSRVYWSDLYQPDRWDGFVDVFPEDGDEITGICSLHNNLVVMKRTHTYLILGSSPDNFEVRLANPNRGCVAPRTLQVMDNAVIARGVDAVHAFDGANFVSISEKIRPDIEAVQRQYREFCAAGVWRSRYYLAQEET
jgi:hypothetical protein